MKSKNLHEDLNTAATSNLAEAPNPTAPEPGSNKERKPMQLVKPPISQAKLEANARNAKKSTGPRTVIGKRRVRWNALKHGLLLRDIVAYWENQEEYDALLAALVRGCKPVGALEFLCVKRMADAQWQELRAQRYEKGESFRLWRQAWQRYKETYPVHRPSELGGRIYLLECLGKEVRRSDSISDRSMSALCERFKAGPGHFVELFLTLRRESKKSWSDDHELLHLVAPEQKKDLLQAIKNQRKSLSSAEDYWEKETERDEDVLNAVASLLPPSCQDNMLRYRTFADRNLHRAADRLERLQRRRKGGKPE